MVHPTVWPHMATFEQAVELAQVARRKRSLARAKRKGATDLDVSASQCEASARSAESKLRVLANAALYEVEHYGTFAEELVRRATLAKALEGPK